MVESLQHVRQLSPKALRKAVLPNGIGPGFCLGIGRLYRAVGKVGDSGVGSDRGLFVLPGLQLLDVPFPVLVLVRFVFLAGGDGA